MKLNKKTIVTLLGAVTLSLCTTSCLSDGDDTILINGSNVNPLGIPDDSSAEANPIIDDKTFNIPGYTTNVDVVDGWAYVGLTMNGIWDAANESWLRLKGTGDPNQNIWLELDGKPKGIDVYNNSDNDGNQRLIADIVFLVDNSGSMSEEADAIANSILEWTNQLSASGLDLRVGCVGYGDISASGVDGALNMTTPEAFKEYLEKYTGTYRTEYFGGPDGETLRSISLNGKYSNGSYNECGMVAFHFANDNFNFRQGANRVYINFTDEPNQPYGIERFSVEWLNPVNGNWDASMGTIHTVFSSNDKSKEYPWLMSEYTGGTVIYTDSNFKGVTLSDLPVTGSLQNSYLVRFTNIEDKLDGQNHTIHITIITPDRKIASEQTMIVNFGLPK